MTDLSEGDCTNKVIAKNTEGITNLHKQTEILRCISSDNFAQHIFNLRGNIISMKASKDCICTPGVFFCDFISERADVLKVFFQRDTLYGQHVP